MNSYRLLVPKRGYMPDIYHVGWWFGSISVTFSPNYHTRFTSWPNHLLCYFPTHRPSTYCVFYICQMSIQIFRLDLVLVKGFLSWISANLVANFEARFLLVTDGETRLSQWNTVAVKRRCSETPLQWNAAGATAGLGASRRTASQHWRPALIWNNLIHVAWHREPHKIPCCSRIPCCCKIPCRDFC